MTKHQRHSLGSLGAVLAICAIGTAQAVPVNGQGNNVNSGPPDCRMTDVQSRAVACLGFRQGSDNATGIATLAASAGWAGLAGLAQYKDTSKGAGSTTSLFDLDADSPADNDDSTGTITFLQGLSGPFVLALKDRQYYAAYHFTGGIAAGTTLAFDIPGGDGGGSARAAIYADPSTVVPVSRAPAAPSAANAVPEPQTWSLALLAAGAGACVRRRRRPPAAH